MKFKAKFALLKRNTEVREIAGQTFTFYPISVPMLFELKSTMEPLMKGLQAMFKQQGQHDGTQTVDETRDSAGNVLQRVTHLGAPAVDVVKFRVEQEQKGTADMIEAVLGEKNRMLLGRVLADSLRDEGITKDDEIKEFIYSFDLPLLVEFLGGFFAVNVKVFGPLAQRVTALVKQKLADRMPSKSPAPESASAADESPESAQASPKPFGHIEPLPS